MKLLFLLPILFAAIDTEALDRDNVNAISKAIVAAVAHAKTFSKADIDEAHRFIVHVTKWNEDPMHDAVNKFNEIDDLLRAMKYDRMKGADKGRKE